MNNSDVRGFPALCIGGSAGALEPLIMMAREFPGDYPAAVFVTTHVPATSVSAMPQILNRAGTLFATHAIDGAPITPGRIIVAPPNHHLVLEPDVMRVLDGPTENNHRPSIDVLFRSAAMSFGTGACGVLLSGTLDDGVAGLIAIHQAGGMTLAQDPDEAEFADMPANAIKTGIIDGVGTAQTLVDAVVRWARGPITLLPARTAPRDERQFGVPSVFTCPDCSGTLWELDDEAVLRFRCRTGHAYSGASMLSAHEHHLESALWASIRALEERRDLLVRLATRSRRNGDIVSGRRYESRFAEVEADILSVRSALAGLFSAVANPA